MFRIANLSIDPVVFENFPESLAREECVLPLGFCGDKFRVIAGKRPEAELLAALRRVAFITDLRLLYSLAEPERVKALVDELFSYGDAEISNCPVEFQVRCPRQWLELRPTDCREIRYCDECKKSVHLCKSEREAKEQARLGRCIALIRDEWVIDIGLLVFPEDSAAQ